MACESRAPWLIMAPGRGWGGGGDAAGMARMGCLWFVVCGGWGGFGVAEHQAGAFVELPVYYAVLLKVCGGTALGLPSAAD